MRLPPHLRCVEFVASPGSAIETPPFTGPVVRAALGAALRLRACTQACGDGACRVGPGCAYVDCFEPQYNQARFRLDSADLDDRTLNPGDRWTLRLVSLSADPSPLFDAVEPMLWRGLGPRRTPHRLLQHQELAALPDSLAARAAAWAGHTITLRLVTPATFRRDGQPVAEPHLDDVLRAIVLRARAWGIEEIPAITPVNHECITLARVQEQRYSARQDQVVPLQGALGAWRLEASASVAELLALGELVGVGKGTALGAGVLRVSA